MSSVKDEEGDKKEGNDIFLLKVQFRGSTYYLWSYSTDQKMAVWPQLAIMAAEVSGLYLGSRMSG